MVNISAITVQLSGDVGGIGQSKWHFQRLDETALTVGDCNSAAAAVHTFYNSIKSHISASTTLTFEPLCNVVDHNTGAPGGIIVLTSVPAAITCLAGGAYGGGVGGRLNWKTPSVHNRRYIRGCTFITPFTASSLTALGAVDPGAVSDINTAAAQYITDMGTASLDPIIWHRPPKGTESGGAVGLITSGVLSAVPCSLRSRRVLRCAERYTAGVAEVVSTLTLRLPGCAARTLWIPPPLISTGSVTPRERSCAYSDVLLHSDMLPSDAGKGRSRRKRGSI